MTDRFRAKVLASSEVAGRGTVVIVEVGAGDVAVGSALGVGGLPASVAAVEPFAQDEEEIAEGLPRRLGLLLTGVALADVARGTEVTGR